MAVTSVKAVITTASVVVAAQDQVSSDLAGEAVILSLQTGRYYGLRHVGAEIWDSLKTATRVAAICDAIVRRYDVPRDRCERDVLTFLQQLADQGLVEIRNGIDP